MPASPATQNVSDILQSVRRIFIGCDFLADKHALARMGEMAAAANPAGWPGDARGGIFDGTEVRVSRLRRRDAKEFRAQARPQPSNAAPLVRPARGISKDAAFALPAGGRTWGVKDG